MWSPPDEFVRRISVLPGDLWPAFEGAYQQPLRRGVRLNPLKMTPEQLAHPERSLALALSPAPFSPLAFYLDEAHRAGSDPFHHAGAYYMQEPSAASAVSVLAPRPGEKILDLCAAPGGKSTQIAAAMENRGLLWCNEYTPSRVQPLMQNLERCGVRHAVVSSCEVERLCTALSGYFDRILVDAPCSGEGMFRKEPQAMTGWSLDNIRLCARRQADILDAAAKALRPGGRLVYSTCTFAPEENELTVAAFLARHPEFSLEPIPVTWGCPGFPGDALTAFGTCSNAADLTLCRRILPHQGGEGHFIACLQKDAAAPCVPAAADRPQKPDKNRDAALALYQDCFFDAPDGEPVTVADTLRLFPAFLPPLEGVGVRMVGVALARLCKNRLEPCHSIFAAARGESCRRILSLSPEEPRLTAFLWGEEIPVEGEAGFTAVAVDGIPLGFGKNSGGRLKNRYPKGLRLVGNGF